MEAIGGSCFLVKPARDNRGDIFNGMARMDIEGIVARPEALLAASEKRTMEMIAIEGTAIVAGSTLNEKRLWEIRNSEAKTSREDHRYDPDTHAGAARVFWGILGTGDGSDIREAYLLKCFAAGAGRMPFTRRTLKKITNKWLGDLAAGQPAKSRVGCR